MSHFDCPECPDQHAHLRAAEARIAELERERDRLEGVMRELQIPDLIVAQQALAIAQERDALRAHVAHLAAALREIKDRPIQVCAEFETCTHVVCAASYAAFAIADAALAALSAARKRET